MNIKDDTLYKMINSKAEWFNAQAARHKTMNHGLWFASSITSILIAICANFPFEVNSLSSHTLTALLAIILPVITGYTLLRSPKHLWIMEIDIRNRLLDLRSEIELHAERDSAFDRTEYEQKYLQILTDSNTKWREIKSNEN